MDRRNVCNNSGRGRSNFASAGRRLCAARAQGTECRLIVKRRWLASAGRRPQIRHGCLATNLTCSLSRSVVADRPAPAALPQGWSLIA
jgi:hypothetical protein